MSATAGTRRRRSRVSQVGGEAPRRLAHAVAAAVQDQALPLARREDQDLAPDAAAGGRDLDAERRPELDLPHDRRAEELDGAARGVERRQIPDRAPAHQRARDAPLLGRPAQQYGQRSDRRREVEFDRAQAVALRQAEAPARFRARRLERLDRQRNRLFEPRRRGHRPGLGAQAAQLEDGALERHQAQPVAVSVPRHGRREPLRLPAQVVEPERRSVPFDPLAVAEPPGRLQPRHPGTVADHVEAQLEVARLELGGRPHRRRLGRRMPVLVAPEQQVGELHRLVAPVQLLEAQERRRATVGARQPEALRVALRVPRENEALPARLGRWQDLGPPRLGDRSGGERRHDRRRDRDAATPAHDGSFRPSPKRCASSAAPRKIPPDRRNATARSAVEEPSRSTRTSFAAAAARPR